MEKGMSFLQAEYFHLQKTVETFDERALTIKGWSVTVSMFGIGAAYLQHVPYLLLLSSGSALLFWIIEALWKTFQRAFSLRLEEMERYLNGEAAEQEFKYPYISLSWSSYWRSVSFMQVFFWPHVFLPHLIIFLVGLGLFMLGGRV
jgi:hypothetical protein